MAADREALRIVVGQRWQRYSYNDKPIGTPVRIAEIRGRVVRWEEPIVDGLLGADMSLLLPGGGYVLVEDDDA
jgi:hypothetical protein